MHAKPKLVFFQSQYTSNVPSFLRVHKQEHVRCLSQFFDVTVISKDCDLEQVCDEHQPDLLFVESAYSGTAFSCCPPVRVRNLRACSQIPRLGFFHADAYCKGRAGFLSDMDRWGINEIFAIATTAPDHTPEIADRTFLWPNFVDTNLYHDYDQWKSIPVLFTGNKNAQYPWRQRVLRLISMHFPSLICPHPGYGHNNLRDPDAGARAKEIVGETYARTLNASWFVPTCGTVANELVRKHLEIPACKACLVTEKSEALIAAGFVDMKNCVFADEDNVLDKLDFLFNNRETLAAITEKGHDLVHSRHSMEHRDQILQWFQFQQIVKGNQRIVQDSPFGGLRIVEGSSGAGSCHVKSNGLHMKALAEGDLLLWRGKYSSAEHLYLESLNYIPWWPEPKLRLALCDLYRGNPRGAFDWLSESIKFTLHEYKAADPDPVEWAYSIVALLCLGKQEAARKRIDKFPHLHHPELDRVRWTLLQLDGEPATSPDMATTPGRSSMHCLPARSLGDWVKQIQLYLAAAGQDTLARRVQHLSPKCEASIELHTLELHTPQIVLHRRPHTQSYIYAFKTEFASTAKRHLGPLTKQALHNTERRFGYFLPYRFSSARRDPFFKAIEDVGRNRNVRTAILLGASVGKHWTDAFMAGAQENPNEPAIYCVTDPRQSPFPASKWMGLDIKPYVLRVSSDSAKCYLESLMHSIGLDDDVSAFDAVVVDGTELQRARASAPRLDVYASNAYFVVILGLATKVAHQLYSTLLNNPRFVLAQIDVKRLGGFAHFELAGYARTTLSAGGETIESSKLGAVAPR